jgi:macrolide-specific efflux system membrane fusion protein
MIQLDFGGIRGVGGRAAWLRRSWIVALATIVLLFVFAIALNRRRSAPSSPAVETGPVARGHIEDTVTALGKVQPRDSVDVGAQVSGQLKRILVQPGDRVDAGDLLAEIDPQLQRARLEVDRARLAQLEADRAAQELELAFARSQLERQTALRRDDATREDTFEMSQRDVDLSEVKRKGIEAQIRQASSTLHADEAELGFTRIYAPMTGTVISVEARRGQTLIAAQQVPIILRIADLSTMTVWTQVSEADISRLRQGMPLYFTTLGQPGRRWDAKLRQVLPAPAKSSPGASTANNVVLYTALFDVDNSKGELKADMSAQVFFVVASADDALTVPVAALHQEAGVSFVTIARTDGQLERRTVTTSVKNRFEVQVSGRLEPGERVVTAEKPEQGTWLTQLLH